MRNGQLPALLLLISASGLLYATLTSPRYVVQHVVLEGGNALTQDDVEALAGVQGEPIWQVRPQDVELRVEQSPYVEDADAHVLLPATVVVQVRERQPAMRWHHNGSTYEVAQDGRILAEVTSASPPEPLGNTGVLTDSEVLTGTDALANAEVMTGTEIVTSSEALTNTMPVSPTESLEPTPSFQDGDTIVVVDITPNRELKPNDYVDADALEVARRVALRAEELPEPLQRITWEQNIGIVLEVGNRTAVIGSSERLDEKLAILVQVLQNETAFSYLDLRPTAPYYR